MELIRTEMTPRERLTAYAKGEEVDRIPATLSAGETGPLMYGIKICDYYFSAELMAATESALAEDFHADNMGMGLGLRTVAEALGTKLKYPDDAVSYIVEPRLKSFDELDQLELLNVEKDGRLPIIIEAFRRLQDRFSGSHIIGSGLAGPFTTAAALIGTEKFLRALIKDKENAHRLMQFTSDCIVECCRDMNRLLGIKFSLSEPIASGALLSIKHAREFFFPYLKQCIDRMNGFQGSTALHICGATRDRWHEIVDCGPSGFWIDNCESLAELKNAFGERIAISGNVTPVDVLKDGTPELVAEHVRRCIEEGADNPRGYTLCPGCTTPVMTPKENLTAFMNAAAVYGRGAKRGKRPKGLDGA